MKQISLVLILMFLIWNSVAIAQEKVAPEKKPIRVVVKDATGEKTEGFMFIYPEEVAVSTKEQGEKSIPLMAIQSIKVEKVPRGIPGDGQLTGEEYYSVRLENSQEILTLDKKYTVSLKTSVGVVTKTLDPSLLSKESSPSTIPQSDKPFIRDKSLILSLELKF
jgi:hypothetical protein